MIPAIKQYSPDEPPTSDEIDFTTKNKCIVNVIQQASNKIPLERIKSKKRQSNMFQGTQVRESEARKSELTHHRREQQDRKKHFLGR